MSPFLYPTRPEKPETIWGKELRTPFEVRQFAEDPARIEEFLRTWTVQGRWEIYTPLKDCDERAISFVIKQIQDAIKRSPIEGSSHMCLDHLSDLIWCVYNYGSCCDLKQEVSGRCTPQLIDWDTESSILEKAICLALAEAEIPYPDQRFSILTGKEVSTLSLVDRARALAKENGITLSAFLRDIRNLAIIDACGSQYLSRLELWPTSTGWFEHKEQAYLIDECLSQKPSDARLWWIGAYNGEDLVSLATLRRRLRTSSTEIEYIGTDICPPSFTKIMPAWRGTVDDAVGVELSSQLFTQIGVRWCTPTMESLRGINLFQSDITDTAVLRCDVVVCNNVLGSLEPEARVKALQNIFHGLKPGGKAFFENDTMAARDRCEAAHAAICDWAATKQLTVTDFSAQQKSFSTHQHCFRLSVDKPYASP